MRRALESVSGRRLARSLFLPLALFLSLASCRRASLPAPGGDPHDDEGRAPAAAHAHGADEEPSDLDRPVSELTAATCEHRKRTLECDECRYEVGFVRAPAALVTAGLFATTRPERRKVSAPVVLTGEVKFDERRVGHVSTQVEGLVQKVHVLLGERVERGAPLVEIESVAVGEEQIRYREAQGLLELARQSFERVSKLSQAGIAAEKELLEAKQELDAAELRAEGARATLRRLGAGGTTGGRLVLRAPLDGTVLAMHVVSGEVARTEEPLLTVGDHAAVWVWADLYEKDLAAVRSAPASEPLVARITVKAYPGDEFRGTVDWVSPVMDERSRTVKARVQVANGDGRLLAGMFARVEVFLPGTEEALSLPAEAVLTDEGRAFVFVHHEGDYWVRRPVELGRRWAGWVEIRRSVTPSQTVVADGAFLMKSDVLRSKMGAGCAD